MAFITVNWLAIFLAAVAAWVFSAVYYTSLGTTYMTALGKTPEQCQSEMAAKSMIGRIAPFVAAFIGNLIIAWALYGLLAHLNVFSLRGGAISGALSWFGFVITTMAVNNAFTGRSPRITLIDGGNWLGAMVICGAIVGWFGP